MSRYRPDRAGSWLFLALALLPSLPAQLAQGRVTGFAGEPVADVVVNLVDAAGTYLADTSTRGDGSWSCTTRRQAARVRAWLEGVELEKPVSAGVSVEVAFARTSYFTLRGNAVDPMGRVLPSLVVQVRAANDDWLATVRTDAKGAFRVRCNRPVDHLLADPDGWRQVVPARFAADAGIAVDLRLPTFFRVTGTVRDENGAAVPGAEVHLVDERGAGITGVRSGATGTWEAWTNRPVARLRVRAGDVRCERDGSWRAAATIDVDWRGAGLVVLTGTLRDAGGRAVVGALVYGLDSPDTGRHLPEPVGRTDAQGAFRVLVPSTQAWLVALHGEQQATLRGPWPKDDSVALVLGAPR